MSYIWTVERVTTDKLQDELNSTEHEVHLIQYTGGRDWVIISRRDLELFTYRGYARHTGDWWEITIPSMGPEDEPIKTQAKKAVHIDRMAREAIAVTNDMSIDEIRVDIDIDP